MLFRRRQPQSFMDRIRVWLWPRVSFHRSFSYFKKRILRLNATPHAIAAGFAAGVLASFTPFVGFHFLMAFAIAYCIAGNMASAALGTAVGNPLTFPFIWGVSYEIGSWVLRDEPIGEAPPGLGPALRHGDFSAIWTPVIKPMLVGGLPLGLAAAVIAYGITFVAVRSFQRRRRTRLTLGRGQAGDALKG